MTGTVQNLLAELKSGLEDLYGKCLQGLYLYGSYARSEQQWDSDVDILIVLNQINSYGSEIDRTSEIISSLSLKYGVSISRVFVNAETWREPHSGFLSSVREKAIAA
ncbi:MAG: nucleotidyltransferase domain-containing protein [Acidobacteriaceae bacterium]|nr:nucleotidyltransferase domain-containing protein [Acidobacteriaceae bacterium]